MKIRALCCIILFVTCISGKAQPLSREQALLIAEQLYQKKFLSQKGRNTLQDKIRKNDLSDEISISLYPDNEISRASILSFCHIAFYQESMYRSGLIFSKRGAQKQQKANKRAREKFKDDHQAYTQWSMKYDQKQYARLYRKAEKRSGIEKSIQAEDSVIEHWHALPLGYHAPKSEPHIIDRSRSTIGRTRTRTAKDLHEVGLVDDKIYNEITKALRDSVIFTEGDVCRYALERSIYYERYPDNKSEQLALLDRLVAGDVLAPEQRDAIRNSYGEYELKTDFEIFKYCRNALVLDTKNYSDPVKFYSFAFSEIKKILPALNFSDLLVKLDSVREFDLTRYDITITFNANNNEYSHVFFYDYKSDSLTDDSSGYNSMSRSDFYEGINKWFADQHSRFRLYRANPAMQADASEDTVFGLIVLTKEQRKLWTEDFSFLSTENHDNRYNSTNLSRTIKTFDSLGLFAHLSALQMAKAKADVKKEPVHSYVDLLRHFPYVIHIFDWETGNLENPYEEHCLIFSQLSRGNFVPVNVQDDFAKNLQNQQKKITFSFEFNGRKYEKMLDNNGDWLDPEFLSLIRQALKENNVNGDFYTCCSGGQVSGVIFLTQEQHRFIEQHFPEIVQPK